MHQSKFRGIRDLVVARASFNLQRDYTPRWRRHPLSLGAPGGLGCGKGLRISNCRSSGGNVSVAGLSPLKGVDGTAQLLFLPWLRETCHVHVDNLLRFNSIELNSAQNFHLKSSSSTVEQGHRHCPALPKCNASFIELDALARVSHLCRIQATSGPRKRGITRIRNTCSMCKT